MHLRSVAKIQADHERYTVFVTISSARRPRTGPKLSGVKFESESKDPGSTVACNTRTDL